MRKGTVEYYDGNQCTGFPLRYCLSDDWLILRSIEEYQVLCKRQLKKRVSTPPLDTRAILYGEPLLDFILRNVQLLDVRHTSHVRHTSLCRDSPNTQLEENQEGGTQHRQDHMYDAVVEIHRRWLMTHRDDLNGQSPREVLFAKQKLIDSDLDSRINQWSFFLEEPPCLSRDSHAYRFAGAGRHEWVMYYDLVRFLIWEAVDVISSARSLGETYSSSDDPLSFTPGFSLGTSDAIQPGTVSTVSYEQSVLSLLDQLKNIWLSEPNDGYIPAEVIDNERRRRPEAMTGRSMVIDEDCPCCKMMGDLSETGLEITFCHFDGSHMEDEFAFSWFATLEEWEREQLNSSNGPANELRKRDIGQPSDDFDGPS
jgi:hypothetical protein